MPPEVRDFPVELEVIESSGTKDGGTQCVPAGASGVDPCKQAHFTNERTGFGQFTE